MCAKLGTPTRLSLLLHGCMRGHGDVLQGRPSSAASASARAQLLQVLLAMAAELGTSVLYVEGRSGYGHKGRPSCAAIASAWPYLLQVLLAMAAELGSFVQYVGGPQHAHHLLAPLEGLAVVEETVVRDKAVESLNKVAAQLPDGSISEHYVPLVKVSGPLFGSCLKTRGCVWSEGSSLRLAAGWRGYPVVHHGTQQLERWEALCLAAA